MSDPDFPIFDEAGCPYAPGTVDHVVWAHGFRAGLLLAKKTVDEAVHAVAPKVRDKPVTIDWPDKPPVRSRFS